MKGPQSSFIPASPRRLRYFSFQINPPRLQLLRRLSWEWMEVLFLPLLVQLLNRQTAWFAMRFSKPSMKKGQFQQKIFYSRKYFDSFMTVSKAIDFQNLSIPELWESPQYNEFLRKFTEIKCQFDDIEGQMYYFLKINPIDTDLLNAAVKELNVTLSFKWFSTEELLQISSGYQIEKAIQQFAAIVNIPEHIKQTALYHELPLAEQNVYILLIYKKTHIEFEYFIGHLPALYLGIYRRNRETWLIFNPARDEYPSEDILKIAKGISKCFENSSYHFQRCYHPRKYRISLSG